MLPRRMSSDQRSHSRIRAAQRLGQRRPQLQRLTALATAQIRKAAQRAGNQVIPLPVGVWPVRAEAGHRRQHHLRIALRERFIAQPASRQIRLRLMRDHHIRPAEQVLSQRQIVRLGWVDNHAALRCIRIQKGRRRLDLLGTRKRTPSPGRIAFGRLQLDHLRAEIAQQLRRKRPR